MKFKKLLLGMVSITIISSSSIAVFANNTDASKIAISKNLDAAVTEGYRPNLLNKAYFNSFSGTVKEITSSESVADLRFVAVENEAGQQATILLTKDSYILGNTKIDLGASITGYYDANAPRVMIYPPQYSCDVVAVDYKQQNIKVDLFNKDLISSDNTLKLNMSKETEIILQNGNVFSGELANKKLVALYTISTKSIPAQTTPSKVIVLSEKAVNVSNMDIVVNGKKIQAPNPYTNAQGTVMLPLRAITEALGFDVGWNGSSQSITIGKDISLTLGQDQYSYMTQPTIPLGTAPVLNEATTFVPLSFFTDVLPMTNATISDSQIVINNKITK
jgi:hypothetical protein